MKKLIGAAIATLAVISVPAQAEGETHHRDLGDIYTQCGLGGLIAPKIPWLAVTTNIVWDLGLTATSSEITSPNSCKGSSAQAAALILETYPALERELAQGSGEHIDALLSTASCAGESRGEMSSALRAELSGLANQADYSQQSRLDHAKGFYAAFARQADAHACNLS